MPSFRRVCEAIAEAWRERRAELIEQSDKLTEAIDRDLVGAGNPDAPLNSDMLETARAQIAAQFEPRYGGFGRAPKFPQANTIDFLCRTYVRWRRDDVLEMITTTLDAMAAGGIHDHLGGGFARYSTDDYWLVPHFEKMLYDNALLTRAYLHGFMTTGEPRYAAVVEDIVGYVLRDLAHPEGGFFCAEDADSEGVEGKFYCWSLAEVREVCGDDADAAVAFFGITEGGNFEDPHTGFRGSILYAVDREARPSAAVERARAALFARRATRVRPGLDDKVLLAWNALFLDALTEAAAVLDHDEWMGVARANARFLLHALRRDDGRFLRSWNAPYLAYAEDYAALLEALCTLAEHDDVAWLDEARSVADELLRLFLDPDAGCFFTTGNDAERLIVRAKDFFDDATPSANSLAAHGLLRLAALTGETRYEATARDIVEKLAPVMTAHPTAFAHLLGALERIVTPPLEIALVGAPDDPDLHALRRVARSRLLPASVMLSGLPSDASPLLEGRVLVGDAATAYVCEHYACQQPATKPEMLDVQLSEIVRRYRAAT
jgi:uncharacterized protein YyaL (SSP411 family)